MHIKNVASILMIGLLFVGALVYGPQVLNTDKVDAAGDSTLSGYAWSSNIGWISFEAEHNSNVIINESGNFDGYAWSSNIGWIDFGGLEIVTEENENLVTGAARACSVFDSGCSGDLKGGGVFSSELGGWDGQIFMSGFGTGTGRWENEVTLVGENFAGFAWGDLVVGWVDMSSVSCTGPCGDTEPPLEGDVDIQITINGTGEVHDDNGVVCSGTDITCLINDVNITINPGQSETFTAVEDTTLISEDVFKEWVDDSGDRCNGGVSGDRGEICEVVNDNTISTTTPHEIIATFGPEPESDIDITIEGHNELSLIRVNCLEIACSGEFDASDPAFMTNNSVIASDESSDPTNVVLSDFRLLSPYKNSANVDITHLVIEGGDLGVLSSSAGTHEYTLQAGATNVEITLRFSEPPTSSHDTILRFKATIPGTNIEETYDIGVQYISSIIVD